MRLINLAELTELKETFINKPLKCVFSMQHEQDSLYQILKSESKIDNNPNPRFRFHEQYYVGGGAHGANFLLDKLTASGEMVVQKVEKVGDTNGTGLTPFSEVIYGPDNPGFISCDGRIFPLNKKQILRLKGSVASYIALRKLREEPSTQKIINDPYLENIDREFFRFNNTVYQRTTMLYEHGVSLDELSKISPLDVVRMLNLLTTALDTYNKKRIIHRDIKPGNIVINKRKPGLSDFRIIDFSTCRIRHDLEGYQELDSDIRLLLETVVRESPVGTPGYMSRGAILGEPSYNSDLYALGITAYKLLKTKFPFNDKKPDQIKLLMNAINLKQEIVDKAVDDLIKTTDLNKDFLAMMLYLCSPKSAKIDPQGLNEITSKILQGEIPLYKSSSVSVGKKGSKAETPRVVISEEEDGKIEEPTTLDLHLMGENTTAVDFLNDDTTLV